MDSAGDAIPNTACVTRVKDQIHAGAIAHMSANDA